MSGQAGSAARDFSIFGIAGIISKAVSPLLSIPLNTIGQDSISCPADDSQQSFGLQPECLFSLPRTCRKLLRKTT